MVEVIYQQGKDTDENQQPSFEEGEIIGMWVVSCVFGIHDERNLSNECGMISKIYC